MRVAKILKSAGSTRLPGLLLAVLLCAVSSTSVAGALYKWVDENGNVRYSDRVPPDQTRNKHQQLNSQGIVLSTKDAAKAPEEIAIETEANRKLEEQQRAMAVQKKHDRVLLLTFSSGEEIELARDNRLQVMDSVIRLIESSIETTQGKLDHLLGRAQDSYIAQGKEVPGGLAQKIEHFERKIESRDAQLQLKLAEREKVRQKYEADLERFQILKSASN